MYLLSWYNERMIKPHRLRAGDTIAIVSMSRGVLGEDFAAHERPLLEKRLAEFGLKFRYMTNALAGMEYLSDHPEARAADLKEAFLDDSIAGVFCAIGGDDTFKTVPYLLDDQEFVEAVRQHPKVFLGFSDTTINHLMFYKLGLQTYYGLSLLTDFAEFADEMLPYTRDWVNALFEPSPTARIRSSSVWYDERKSYGPDQIGTNRTTHEETRGYEVLRGTGSVTGKILGGCIDSLNDALSGQRYADESKIIQAYGVFPSIEDWKDKILFVETSEERPSPGTLRQMIERLESFGVLGVVSAILIGKPQDETYYDEYKVVWREMTETYKLPILYNFNIGHATPRCILPYDAEMTIDFDNATVTINEPYVM